MAGRLLPRLRCPGGAVTGVSGGTLSCAGLEALWEAAGGSHAEAFMAAEIAMAESGGQQYALSPTNDYGYWQINGSHGPAQATFSPMGNAQAAVAISADGTDWSPVDHLRHGCLHRAVLSRWLPVTGSTKGEAMRRLILMIFAARGGGRDAAGGSAARASAARDDDRGKVRHLTRRWPGIR